MNTLFASYVTGSAFRIDLSSRMVKALLSAAQGNSLNTGNYGVPGLIHRGLMELVACQKPRIYMDVCLTEAGKKVADLCVMAGLEVK